MCEEGPHIMTAPGESLYLVPPKITPPLDSGFRPAVLANRAFQAEVGPRGIPLVFGLERDGGNLSRFETQVLPIEHPRSAASLSYAERLLKFLLWQRGGYRVYVGGPRCLGESLRECYGPASALQFDYHFMGEAVYERELEVIPCEPEGVPPARTTGRPLGRHLDGGRIGFDLGASDRKVSAIIDGELVFSEEVVWEPRKQSDPEYHYREIMAGLKRWLARQSPPPGLDVVGCEARQAVARQIAERSVTLVRDRVDPRTGKNLLPLRLESSQRLAVILPRPQDLTPADTSSYVALSLAETLRGYHPNVDEVNLPHSPQDTDISAIREKVLTYDLILVGTLNAYSQPGQASLVRALFQTDVPTIVVALRMPYVLAVFPDAQTYLGTYSIQEPSLQALARGLFGQIEFQGRLPVSIPGLHPAGFRQSIG